jgi:hypothetical protein
MVKTSTCNFYRFGSLVCYLRSSDGAPDGKYTAFFWGVENIAHLESFFKK